MCKSCADILRGGLTVDVRRASDGWVRTLSRAAAALGKILVEAQFRFRLYLILLWVNVECDVSFFTSGTTFVQLNDALIMPNIRAVLCFPHCVIG